MRIGIVGAGQLGRMMALAGLPMGLSFQFLDTSGDSPGAELAPSLIGPLDDHALLVELAQQCDVVTFDVENLPRDAAAAVSAITGFAPSVEALATAQDRLAEKRLFAELGIRTAKFHAVDTLDELHGAVEALGLPAVLKKRRQGYDGRGQRFLQQAKDIDAAWHMLGAADMILEAFVPFDREVSLIGVRNRRGEIRCYPLTCNVHWQGMLDFSTAPLDEPALAHNAETCVRKLLQHFDYAGVLSVEFFVVDGTLLANEMAPRVHNSGHWTIEGAATSQFENHLRGILDLPLGDTRATGFAAMVNFLGNLPPRHDVLAIEGCHYHDYRKSPRPRRKIGHATVVCTSQQELDRRLDQLRRVVGPRR